MHDQRKEPPGQGTGAPKQHPSGEEEAAVELEPNAAERPETHDSGRRADRHRGPGEGAD